MHITTWSRPSLCDLPDLPGWPPNCHGATMKSKAPVPTTRCPECSICGVRCPSQVMQSWMVLLFPRKLLGNCLRKNLGCLGCLGCSSWMAIRTWSLNHSTCAKWSRDPPCRAMSSSSMVIQYSTWRNWFGSRILALGKKLTQMDRIRLKLVIPKHPQNESALFNYKWFLKVGADEASQIVSSINYWGPTDRTWSNHILVF